MCNLNLQERYVNECLLKTENEECIFFSGVVLPQHYAASLSDLRLDSVRHIRTLEDWQIDDIAHCVEERKSTEATIGIADIFFDTVRYTFFYEPASKKVLGIYKYFGESLKHEEKTDYKSKYFKRTFFGNWK